MSLNNNIRVPLPKKGIAYKKNNNTTYVYFTTLAYRDKNGNPTNKRTAIGKLDEESKMLIPNNSYYKFFENSNVSFLPEVILNFGAIYLLDHILNELNITEFLKSAFPPELARKIELIASYMCIDSSVMFYIDDFCTSNFIKDNLFMTSSNTSSVFDKITHSDKMQFYRKWVKHVGENEYIAYDVTSISSYSENQGDVEYGYNRDGERLAQINLGMYFGEDTGIPIFYTKYAGSILDKSYLKYMMLYNEELDIQNVSFVMDKGFYTKDNLAFMKAKEHPFIMCVSNKLITSNKLLEKHGASIASYSNYIKTLDVYAVRDIVSTYGIKTDVHIYYDEGRARVQKKDLYLKIEKYEFELYQLKQLTKRQYKLYSKYFDIKLNDDNTFEFEKNGIKIDELAEKYGYFILISTVENKNSEEILNLYRRKDKVEKSFDNLKNHLDFKRLRTHKDSTTEGKLFVAFISLIIKSYMDYKLKDYFEKTNNTIEKVIRELNKIKIMTTNTGQHLMSPLTSKQKKILAEFNITEENIIGYINSI